MKPRPLAFEIAIVLLKLAGWALLVALILYGCYCALGPVGRQDDDFERAAAFRWGLPGYVVWPAAVLLYFGLTNRLTRKTLIGTLICVPLLWTLWMAQIPLQIYARLQTNFNSAIGPIRS